jgi:hypothetical protein
MARMASNSSQLSASLTSVRCFCLALSLSLSLSLSSLQVLPSLLQPLVPRVGYQSGEQVGRSLAQLWQLARAQLRRTSISLPACSNHRRAEQPHVRVRWDHGPSNKHADEQSMGAGAQRSRSVDLVSGTTRTHH